MLHPPSLLTKSSNSTLFVTLLYWISNGDRMIKLMMLLLFFYPSVGFPGRWSTRRNIILVLWGSFWVLHETTWRNGRVLRHDSDKQAWEVQPVWQLIFPHFKCCLCIDRRQLSPLSLLLFLLSAKPFPHRNTVKSELLHLMGSRRETTLSNTSAPFFSAGVIWLVIWKPLLLLAVLFTAYLLCEDVGLGLFSGDRIYFYLSDTWKVIAGLF